MNEHVQDVLQGHLGFGSGRRVCVGWNVGWKNMFIVFSRLLYCFDFIEDPVLSPQQQSRLTNRIIPSTSNRSLFCRRTNRLSNSPLNRAVKLMQISSSKLVL